MTKFSVYGSVVPGMNGEYEVDDVGFVENITRSEFLKPSIDLVLDWICESGGLDAMIVVGDSSWFAKPGGKPAVMNALGFNEARLPTRRYAIKNDRREQEDRDRMKRFATRVDVADPASLAEFLMDLEKRVEALENPSLDPNS